jgi:hypothetical protein
MGRRAYVKSLALAFACLLTSPAASEDVCIDPNDLHLLYKPGEPPSCPTPMSKLVPSRVGRPYDDTAMALAMCAGLYDAELEIEPSLKGHPDFIDGDRYFEAALARRERPPTTELDELRLNVRERALINLRDPSYLASSMFIHFSVGCDQDYDRAAGE